MWSRWPWEWTIHFTSEGLKPASQMALTSMAAAPQLPESMSSSPSPVSMRWTHTQLSPTYQISPYSRKGWTYRDSWSSQMPDMGSAFSASRRARYAS